MTSRCVLTKVCSFGPVWSKIDRYVYHRNDEIQGRNPTFVKTKLETIKKNSENFENSDFARDFVDSFEFTRSALRHFCLLNQ